jgi:hypothetical protein
MNDSGDPGSSAVDPRLQRLLGMGGGATKVMSIEEQK